MRTRVVHIWTPEETAFLEANPHLSHTQVAAEGPDSDDGHGRPAVSDSSTIWRLNVHGLPMPKGSMSCVGSRGGRGAHTLIESDPSGAKKRWRQHLTEACRDLARKIPGVPLDEPVAVGCLFRLPRPRTSRLAWPTSHQSGDLDKLKRAVLDCLTDGGVLRDDSRVVSMVDAKVYSPEPGVTVYVAAASSLEPLSRMLKAIEEACR